jgi:hypothetical protein
MIDTIQLTVKNLDLYSHLTTTLREYDKGDKEFIISANEKTHHKHQKFIQYLDTNKIVTRYSNKFYVKSSSYYVTYQINYLRNEINFNLSIPKFLYGNNIRQFVQHKMDKNFSFQFNADFKFNANQAYPKLMSFLFWFNERYLNVKREDIYIKRIDFCFNMFFKDQVEKKMYLNYLKKAKKKHSRVSSNNPIYNTGIYFVNKRTTAKIYDKYEEFKKNDLRQIVKNQNMTIPQFKSKIKSNVFPPLPTADIYDAYQLLKISKRVLRYEMEFRNTFLKDIYNERFEKDNLLQYILNNQQDKKKALSDLQYNKRHEFNIEPNSAMFFNKKMYFYCANKFNAFLNNFILSYYEIDKIDEKVNEINRINTMNKFEKNKKIRLGKLKNFVLNLTKYGQKQMIELNLCSKSTYFRNIAELKKIGYIQGSNLAPIAFSAKKTFEEYHSIFY